MKSKALGETVLDSVLTPLYLVETVVNASRAMLPILVTVTTLRLMVSTVIKVSSDITVCSVCLMYQK